MSEQNSGGVLDPFEALYSAMDTEALQRVLKKPHNTDTWKYDRRPPLRFRASEAGNCARRIWYRLTGCVPAPDSADLMLKQREGNAAQDVVRALFKEYKIPIEGVEFKAGGEQVETFSSIATFEVGGTEIKVSARGDGKFPATPHGPAFFEFKTIDHFKNYWLQKAYDGHWPELGKGLEAVARRIAAKYPYYFKQVQITMEVFGETMMMFGTKNRSAVAYGMKSEDGKQSGVYIERCKEAIHETLCMFAMIKRNVLEDKPPIALLDGTMECNFCPFYYRCHGIARNSGQLIYPGVK